MLWKRKRDIIIVADEQRRQEEEKERRERWKFRPLTQRFDKYEKALVPALRWVDERAGLHEWVKGIVVDFSREEGFRVVYQTMELVGFDYIEVLSSHEMDHRSCRAACHDVFTRAQNSKGRHSNVVFLPIETEYHLSPSLIL